ncbi:MAG: HAD hydrolase-like protein [Anaerolineae bacterium]
MIRFLIWDADGTLFDTYPAVSQALSEALRERGVDVPAHDIHRLSRVSFGHCLCVLDEVHDVHIGEMHQGFEEIRDRVSPTDQPPFPGVRALCRYAISIDGANFILTHRDRASLGKLLTAHDLGDLFKDIAAGDDGYPRKPDATGLEALIARNRIPKEEALVIGDRELDVLAGHAAGVRSCFYGTNPCTEPVEFAATDYAVLLEQLRRENDNDNGRPNPPGNRESPF